MELNSKIFVSIMGIALFSVAVASLMFFSSTQVSFEGIIEETQISLAEGAVNEIGTHLENRLELIDDITNDEIISDYLSKSNYDLNVDSSILFARLDSIEDAQYQSNGYYIFDNVTIINKNGFEITNKGIKNKYVGDEEWWQKSKDKGMFIENVDYNENSSYLGIALSIQDSNNDFIGSIKADLNFQEIINIIKGFRTGGVRFTKDNTAYASEKHRTMDFKLVDNQGKLLYSTEEDDLNQFEYLSADMLSKLNREDNKTFSYISDEENTNKLITYYPFEGFNDIKDINWGILIGHEVEDIFYPARNAALKLTVYMIPLILFAGIAILFLIKKIIVKPLSQFTVLTKNIAEGDLDNHLDINSQDEIGMLARSFNLMTDKLKLSKQNIEAKVAQRTEELHKFQLAVENASELTVITDPDGTVLYVNPAVEEITGYKTSEVIGHKAGALWGGEMEDVYYQGLWDTIKHKKRVFKGEINNVHKNGTKIIAKMDIYPILDDQQELMFLVGIARDVTKEKEVDKMKTEFISLASHQLRTPLSAMKWFSEMLLNGDAGDLSGEQKEFVSKINESNERMIALVNSLLSVSRIESGKITIEPVATDLKMLINELLGELKQRIDEKKIKVNLNLSDDLNAVVIDPKMTTEVYSNLITNAVKYTPNDGEINISISLKDGKLISEIKDNGYGIPKSEQSKLFQKFFRATNIIKNDTDGNGLGMYLVQRIVKASGGDISFESEENKGTTFKFSLPENMLRYKQPE